MILPSIHMNGTSRAELQRLNCTAWSKINEAISALQHAAPNARDYYVQGDTAYRQAREEHLARIQRLVSVQEELSKMAYHLSGQTE